MVNNNDSTPQISGWTKENFSFAKRHHVLVSEINDNYVEIVHSPKFDLATLCELRRVLARPIKLHEVSEEEFANLLTQHFEMQSDMSMQLTEDFGEALDLEKTMQELPQATDLLETNDDAPIIRLLNALLSEAIKRKASDIHIETFEEEVSVRYRIDGVLHKILEPPRSIAPLIISRIKIMAKLDIAEKRLPQDGRITVRIAGHAVDIRVATIPASHGERVVLRLLDKKFSHLELANLGMAKQSLAMVKQMISKPHGIILVTGPTGAGKTTTLYAILSQLNHPERNILTVEDPIEYDLKGIGQTQVNSKVDMSFVRGLRAILRQDPDIVMVGEIRDLETAKISVQASLTGHLVLSTLHTNSAIGAVTRLRDMGVEPYLLASTLIGVVAQRLVRLLCPHCKEAYPATVEECKILGVNSAKPPMLYRPMGCHACEHTGYTGRSGVYELVIIDEKLRSMIHADANEQVIESYARQIAPSMRQDGCQRVLSGQTTIAEVLRVTLEDAANGSI